MEQAATTNAMNRVDVQEAKKTVRDYAYNIGSLSNPVDGSF